MSNHVLREVLTAFGSKFEGAPVVALGSAGGFSGAEFWRLESDGSIFCLRKWPATQQNGQHIQFIHDVLIRVAAAGFELVPVPLRTDRGTSLVDKGGHFWELSPWLPGRADYANDPNPQRLVAALTALAEFHQAACGPPQYGVSPGISSRSDFLNELLAGDIQRIASCVANNSLRWPELDERASRLIRLFDSVAMSTLRTLQSCADLRVALQPCIRDIWHDHVLYQGYTVTGIVDFGAMRYDNVATDIARLLGSFAGDDSSGWRAGIEVYQQVRTLTPQEHQLIGAFDTSSVTLSGMNWLKWIYQEGRRFDDRCTIERRLDAMIQRF